MLMCSVSVLLLSPPPTFPPHYIYPQCILLIRLQAQYGVSGSGVDEKIRELPGEIPALMDVMLERVERCVCARACV